MEKKKKARCDSKLDPFYYKELLTLRDIIGTTCEN